MPPFDAVNEAAVPPFVKESCVPLQFELFTDPMNANDPS
jgi:hypothetical protein